jgi:Kef-type K+ transport system membrane component KefB
MSLETSDVAHMLVALTLLVVVAHTLGHLFATLRQPPVIGEILGGLLLGPTVLGTVAPGVAESLFPASGVTASVLGAVYYLGLLLLMFLAGGEVHVHAAREERKTVLSVTTLGLLLPFCAGILIVQVLDYADFSGPRGSPVSFALVFGIAIAVTSIPVISRIMLDLGILNTAFARVVLTVAVLEDVVLYVVLAVILGLVQAQSEDAYGLWVLFGVDSVALSAAYYIVTTLLFFVLFLTKGADIFRWLAGGRVNLLEKRNPTAFRLAFLLALGLCCVALGINPIFGALVAGVCASRADAAVEEGAQKEVRRTWEALKSFSLAFFIPVYFAVVGLQLDLVRNLDVVFFLWFFVVACVVKSFSVWLGARLAGESRSSSVNLAVAMNARGGPGIVLATVTFSAGIINESFFVSLVLLSIVTSQIAGFWLDRTFAGRPAPSLELRRGRPPLPGRSTEP